MKNLSYKHINETPYPTWNWLKMNRSSLDAQIDDKILPCAKISGANAGLIVYKDEGSGCAEITELEKVLPQMEHNSSKDTTDIVTSLHSIKFALIAKNKCIEPVIIDFNLKDGQTYSGRQTIIAEQEADLTVIMDYTSLPFDSGFCAIQTKLWAKAYSKIHLIKVQLLGQKYIHIDDTQSFAEDGAQIEITQIELGSNKAFVNVTSNLAGFNSAFKSDTAYIAKNEQQLDINYCTEHTGKKTDTKMKIRGTILDNAKKLYRGTIDFKKGCSGSTGDEQEETLLASPTAVNRSLPMILCGEDDVAGSHGGTLGHLNTDELFYFQSRGIDIEKAKEIMTRSKVMAVANKIPDSAVIQRIKTFIGEEE